MKPYVKPQLFVESYELSQHVAACGWDINSSEDSCKATWDPQVQGTNGNSLGVYLFNDNATGCTVKPADIEEYCYTTGTEGNNLWNS